MKKLLTNALGNGYDRPDCKLLDFVVEKTILETSLTQDSDIDPGVMEDWGTL